MIEVVKPVIEFRYSFLGILCHLYPDHQNYDRWASLTSEGWCPMSGEGGPLHRLEPAEDGWLGCEAGARFRLVYPNEIEQD